MCLGSFERATCFLRSVSARLRQGEKEKETRGRERVVSRKLESKDSKKKNRVFCVLGKEEGANGKKEGEKAPCAAGKDRTRQPGTTDKKDENPRMSSKEGGTACRRKRLHPRDDKRAISVKAPSGKQSTWRKKPTRHRREKGKEKTHNPFRMLRFIEKNLDLALKEKGGLPRTSPFLPQEEKRGKSRLPKDTNQVTLKGGRKQQDLSSEEKKSRPKKKPAFNRRPFLRGGGFGRGSWLVAG